MGVCSPQVVDLDNDGYLDLIFGEGNNNNLNHYSQKSDGTLHFKGNLINTPIDAWKEVSTSFADMDNDGDFDFIFGSSATWAGGAKLYYFENRGDKNNFSYSNPIEIASGSIVQSAKVTIIDIDGDNLRDIVYSSGFPAKLYFIKNNGSIDNPTFSSNITILKMIDGSEITANTHPINIYTNLKPTFRVSTCDWNHDSIPDLMFGRSIPVVFYGSKGSTTTSSNNIFKNRNITASINRNVISLNSYNTNIDNSNIFIINSKGQTLNNFKLIKNNSNFLNIIIPFNGHYLLNLKNKDIDYTLPITVFK